MPFRLDLSKKLRAQGWKVKILEKERLEPPHVTIYHREKVWRLSLRTGDFIVPPGGGWKEIDPGVRATIEIEANWTTLCRAWDEKYPSNPVSSAEGEEDA